MIIALRNPSSGKVLGLFAALLGLVVVVVVLLAAPLARAQDANVVEVPKLGFVQLGRIFGQSKMVEQTRNDLNGEFTERENSLEEKIDQLQAKEDIIKRNILTQTQAQKDIDLQAVRELERGIKREERDLVEDKRARFDEANTKLEIIILNKIQEVAAKQGIYLVFELSAVLFAEKRLDLTDAVIEVLDKDLAGSSTTTAQ